MPVRDGGEGEDIYKDAFSQLSAFVNVLLDVSAKSPLRNGCLHR